MDVDQERIGAVRSLGALPLFQLSTAGMELFHTNLLFWLAKQHPAASAPLWRALGVEPPDASGAVRREWRHFDLFLECAGGTQALLLENKIGAIPTGGQMTRYWEDVAGARELRSYKHIIPVLLTPTPSRLSVPAPWRATTYADLLPAFEETAEALAGSDRQLISEYVAMLRALLGVLELFDPGLAPDQPVRLTQWVIAQIAENRMGSLIEKYRFARLAKRITDDLGMLGYKTTPVTPELTRGIGIMSWWTPGADRCDFGWQVQGDQFRLVALTGRRGTMNRVKREQLVEASHAAYFDLDGLARAFPGLRPYQGNRRWLGYEPDFVYRYGRLDPATTWDELAAICRE